MEQQEPKVLVCITSYNRQDNLIGLCAALQDENNQSIIPDIVVFDDCTPSLTIFRGPGIKFIQSKEHRGKEGFWKTWQDIFNDILFQIVWNKIDHLALWPPAVGMMLFRTMDGVEHVIGCISVIVLAEVLYQSFYV